MLIKEKKAAEILGRSVGTLQQWRHRKVGPEWILDPFGAVFYDPATLSEWTLSAGKKGRHVQSHRRKDVE